MLMGIINHSVASIYDYYLLLLAFKWVVLHHFLVDSLDIDKRLNCIHRQPSRFCHYASVYEPKKCC